MTNTEKIEVLSAHDAGMRIEHNAKSNEKHPEGWLEVSSPHWQFNTFDYRVHPDGLPEWERIKGEHMGRENRLKEAVTSLWAVLKGTGSITAEDSHDMELMVRSALGVQEGERLAETNLHCKVEHTKVMDPDLPPLPEKDLVLLPKDLKRPKGVSTFDAWVLTRYSGYWDWRRDCYGPEASPSNRNIRYAVKPDTEIARINGVGWGPCPSKWGWHNPKGLTPEQVGVPEKRLWCRDEVGKREKDFAHEVWSSIRKDWHTAIVSHSFSDLTYRTSLPYGSLPPVTEHTFPECTLENISDSRMAGLGLLAASEDEPKPTYGHDLNGNPLSPPSDRHEIIRVNTKVHPGEVTHMFINHVGWTKWTFKNPPDKIGVKHSIRAYARKKYSVLHAESGIKPGDVVEVTRAAEDYERGWENDWPQFMNDVVGKKVKIISDEGVVGFVIKDHNGHLYNVPAFVLRKVERRKVPLEASDLLMRTETLLGDVKSYLKKAEDE